MVKEIEPKAIVQTNSCSKKQQTAFCAIDIEVIDAPTQGILHQQSRMLFILEGEAVMKIQAQPYQLKPGSLVTILPWQYSEVTEVRQPLKYILLIYRFSLFNHLVKTMFNVLNEPLDLIRFIADTKVVHLNEVYQEKMRSVFDRMIDEIGLGLTSPLKQDIRQENIFYELKGQLSTIYLVSLMNEALVLLFRAFENNNLGIFGMEASEDTIGSDKQERGERLAKGEATEETSEQEESVLSKKFDFEKSAEVPAPIEIFHYLFTHLQNKPTLADLSQVFYMSESAISRYIEKETGFTYTDLLTEMRVARTIYLLLYTNATLDDISQQLGFVDAAHVSKTFLNHVGISTKFYRDMFSTINEVGKIRDHHINREVVSYIISNFNTDLKLQKVAEDFNFSPLKLNQMMKYYVEMSFEEFVHYLRINHACCLLLETGQSVLDIAYDVGYQSVKTFTRNFEKLKNMTPREFRKQNMLQKKMI